MGDATPRTMATKNRFARRDPTQPKQAIMSEVVATAMPEVAREEDTSLTAWTSTLGRKPAGKGGTEAGSRSGSSGECVASVGTAYGTVKSDRGGAM